MNQPLVRASMNLLPLLLKTGCKKVYLLAADYVPSHVELRPCTWKSVVVWHSVLAHCTSHTCSRSFTLAHNHISAVYHRIEVDDVEMEAQRPDKWFGYPIVPPRMDCWERIIVCSPPGVYPRPWQGGSLRRAIHTVIWK